MDDEREQAEHSGSRGGPGQPAPGGGMTVGTAGERGPETGMDNDPGDDESTEDPGPLTEGDGETEADSEA